jgi:hypothetical protein
MGLRIRAEREDGDYEAGSGFPPKIATAPLTRNDFHGDWNYSLTTATGQSNVR